MSVLRQTFWCPQQPEFGTEIPTSSSETVLGQIELCAPFRRARAPTQVSPSGLPSCHEAGGHRRCAPRRQHKHAVELGASIGSTARDPERSRTIPNAPSTSRTSHCRPRLATQLQLHHRVAPRQQGTLRTMRSGPNTIRTPDAQSHSNSDQCQGARALGSHGSDLTRFSRQAAAIPARRSRCLRTTTPCLADTISPQDRLLRDARPSRRDSPRRKA